MSTYQPIVFKDYYGQVFDIGRDNKMRDESLRRAVLYPAELRAHLNRVA